jgi:actin, other eukaryote
MDHQTRKNYVGYEAQTWCQVSKHPMTRGVIEDWDQMECLWKHVYAELGVSSKAHPIILADNIDETPASREKMAKVFFEEFDVPSFYVCSQPVLSVYSAGRSQGISIDSGHDATRAVWVWQGMAMSHTKSMTSHAGQFLSQFLEKSILQWHNFPRKQAMKDVVNDVKERLCYVALDFEKEMQSYNETVSRSYELPDCQLLKVGKDRFKVPEALFNPTIFDPSLASTPGIQATVTRTIQASDDDLRAELYGDIILVSIACQIYSRDVLS